MAVIHKKTTPVEFELVSKGVKKFEVRVFDFEINEGDTVVLEEWDAEIKAYTGRSITKKVGFTLRMPLDKYGQKKEIEKHGLVVFSIED